MNSRRFCRFAALFICIIGVAALSGCNISFENRFLRYDDSDYKVGNGAVSELVSEIDIDWIGGNILVETSDFATEITFSETNEGSNESQLLHYCIRGKTLDLKFAASKAKLSNNFKKDLIVTLPLNVSLAKLKIESVSGKVTILGFEGNEMEIDAVSSGIFLESVSAEEVDIDSVSGAIDFRGCALSEIDIDIVSGDSYFRNCSFSKLKIDSVSGDATVHLPSATSGFCCDFDTVSGNFFDDFGATRSGNFYSYGNESIGIEMDSTSGNLSILKE